MHNSKSELSPVDIESFRTILSGIFQILKKGEHNAQAEFIHNLIELVDARDSTLFVKSINGLSMWGGAGAVWEVYFENRIDEKAFERKIIQLIDLMGKANILGKGIVPIRKLFEKDLENE